MTTREKLAALFESRPETWFSGEDLARELSLSRAAVWKAVSALRRDGYPIEAVPNRGYCLGKQTDILSEAGIRKYLPGDDRLITVLDTVDSTNDWLRRRGAEGLPEGTLAAANEQTGGKGRSGRCFYSPRGTGLYLSLLLRPGDRYADLTVMAAAAMCRAIRCVTGKEPGIKWVNDILLDGKKVCGILTEGSFSLETGRMESVVLGAGVNLYPPAGGFPAELASIAGALEEQPVHELKNRLAAEFVSCFFEYYRSEDPEVWAQPYRRYCVVPGKNIMVLSEKGARPARAVELDDRCRLRVRYPDGGEETLSWGEIRIRLDDHNGT